MKSRVARYVAKAAEYSRREPDANRFSSDRESLGRLYNSGVSGGDGRGEMSLMRNFINRVVDDLSSPPILDPNFGLGLPIHFMRQNSKQNKALANIINDKDALKINLDVRHFSPDELTVKVVEDFVVVEGKHEEKDDEHGAISRHFVRRYRLPGKVDKSGIICSLSSDSVLQIHAPKTPAEDEEEREIPITLTNLPALEPEEDENE